MFKRLAVISLVVLLGVTWQTGQGLAANHFKDLIQQYQALGQAGKYREAEKPAKELLAIVEKALGPDHPSTATSLSNLALLYSNQAKYDQAEPLYRRSLAIDEKALGPDHPSTATSLNNLAALRRAQGK